jgi:hypothetical protein
MSYTLADNPVDSSRLRVLVNWENLETVLKEIQCPINEFRTKEDRGRNGMSVLHAVAEHGGKYREEIMRACCSAPEPPFESLYGNNTPLMVANSVYAARTLIAAGASVNRAEGDCTPLMRAGSLGVLNVLLAEDAYRLATDSNGRTALMRQIRYAGVGSSYDDSSRFEQVQVVMYLIMTASREELDHKNDDGEDALFRANEHEEN